MVPQVLILSSALFATLHKGFKPLFKGHTSTHGESSTTVFFVDRVCICTKEVAFGVRNFGLAWLAKTCAKTFLRA